MQLKTSAYGLRIDAEIDGACYPNVMIWVGEKCEEDRLITSSYQILTKQTAEDDIPTVCVGNVGPLSEKLLNRLMPQVHGVANWLRAIGAYGLAGIDFVVEKGTKNVFFLEVNCRINGNNAASFTALQSNMSCVWGAKNTVEVPEGTTLSDFVAFLKKRNVSFSPDSGMGVFVVNQATAEMGKIQIAVCASNYEHANWMLNRIDAISS